MAKKNKNPHIVMESTEGDGHQYHTFKSGKPGGTRTRLELKKYNPKLQKHVVYRESKKSS